MVRWIARSAVLFLLSLMVITRELVIVFADTNLSLVTTEPTWLPTGPTGTGPVPVACYRVLIQYEGVGAAIGGGEHA